MTFRDWKYEDILPVSRLEEKCFRGERWNFPMFASSFSQPSFAGVIGEEDGEILSYACLSCAADECDLLTLAVAEKARGKGIGRETLRCAFSKAKARGAEKMFLEVRKSNRAAIALYQSEGFIRLSERRRYYPDGEDAQVMMREL